jgi:MFS family permease
MAFMDRMRRRPAHEGPGDGRDVVATERQHDEYGGTNWGAAFFGWIVAVGVGALLTALLSAAGAAIALTELTPGEAADSAETISLVGGIALLVVALISYFAGGYVAGRMSRFDGGRQGLGVWIVSIVVAIVLAIIGAIAGSEYNVLGGLELPRIPIDEGDLTTGGVIFLVASVIGTLLAAMAGGKAGERYHRRVDALGAAPARDGRRDVAPDTDGRRRTTPDREAAARR